VAGGAAVLVLAAVFLAVFCAWRTSARNPSSTKAKMQGRGKSYVLESVEV